MLAPRAPAVDAAHGVRGAGMGRAGGVSRRAALGLGIACLACRAAAAAPLACLDGDGEAPAAGATAAAPREHRAARGPHRVLVRSWPDDALHGGLDGATPRLAAQAGLDALAAWRAAGFPAPKLAAGGTLIIELRNLEGARGGASPSWDHVKVERLLRPAALRDTVFHESFHLVQHAANPAPALLMPEGEAILFTPMLREGGARVMEAMARATPTRYEEEAEAWFLPDPPPLGHVRGGARGTPDGPSYAGGLFWAYAAEQHGGAPDAPFAREIRTQRAVLEATRRRPGPASLATLREARALLPGPGDFDRFLYVEGDPALPACAETLWGNFLLALALNGTAGADSRFRFAAAGTWRGAAGRPAAAQPLALGEAADTGALPPFAHRVFRLALAPQEATRLLRLRWLPDEGLADALVQLAVLDRAGELRDLLRHDAAAGALDRVLPLREASALVVILASRVQPGRGRLLLEPAADAPILAATPWNAADGRLLTHDPAIRAHDWRSADLGFNPVAQRDAAGPYRLLLLSLRNRGTLPAAGIEARAEWRPLRGGSEQPLRGGTWQPLEPHAPPPATLLPDDECRRLLREDTAPVTRAQLPCVVSSAGRAEDPTPLYDRAAAMFRWRGPDIRGALIRVTARAAGDPNRALAVLASFGGPPPMQPLPESTADAR